MTAIEDLYDRLADAVELKGESAWIRIAASTTSNNAGTGTRRTPGTAESSTWVRAA